MTQYDPLSRRDGNDQRDYQVLHEGAPPWISRLLVDWLKSNLRSERYGWYERVYNEIELDLKQSFGGSGDHLVSACAVDQGLLLNVIDWMLQHSEHRTRVEVVAEALDRGGSVWEVVEREDEGAYLARRVTRELGVLVADALGRGDVSGEHLKKAWRAAWAFDNNPTEAYDEAVKAVEAVLKPVVSPNNALTTLGTIIADIRNKPGKFAVRLSPRRGADAVEAFRAGLEVLWQAQRRHGDPDEVIEVTPDEARDAVSLAAHVVDWSQRGAFGRVGAD